MRRVVRCNLVATTFQCWDCERRFPEKELHEFGMSWGTTQPGRRSYSSRATLGLCPECFGRQGRLSYHQRLRALVGNDDVDRVLSVVNLDQIADAWCRHRQRFASAPDLPEAQEDRQGRWAVDLLQTRRWWEDENRARAGLLALVDRADADYLLEYVGAEALQTLLTANEGDLRWIEEQAARSEKFRKALGSVQVFGDLPDEVALRVERAAGIRLPRPGGWTGP
jgi:hypothetical protein